MVAGGVVAALEVGMFAAGVEPADASGRLLLAALEPAVAGQLLTAGLVAWPDEGATPGVT